jgi:short-subunit dehydrogenase
VNRTRSPLSRKRILVTGASSGLGEEIAIQLGERHGAALVLTGRDHGRLMAVGQRLADQGCDVELIVADLATPGAGKMLFDQATRRLRVDALVYAAGVHWYGRGEHIPARTAEDMLAVNAVTPVELIDCFMPYFDRGGGLGLMAVTSIGALTSTPFQAMYGGTKAMLHRYVSDLQLERRLMAAPSHLGLVSPGGMWTAMMHRSPVGALVRSSVLMRSSFLPVARVATATIRGLIERRRTTIPGAWNRVLALLFRLVPRFITRPVIGRLYGGR